MKNLKIDNYTIKTVQKETNDNYGLFIHVLKDEVLISGCIVKNSSTDLWIIELGIKMIKENKNRKNKTIEDILK